MKDKEKQNKVFDILDKMEFFQGQRAGRELWNDKPKEVQDKDIADFIKDINYIRSYLQDSVVISREEYEQHANEYKNLSIKYDQVSDKYRLCKDANEGLKQKAISASKETAEKIITFLDDYCDCDSAYLVEQAKEYVVKSLGIEIKE